MSLLQTQKFDLRGHETAQPLDWSYTIKVRLPSWRGTFELDFIEGFDPSHIVCRDEDPYVVEVGIRA